MHTHQQFLKLQSPFEISELLNYIYVSTNLSCDQLNQKRLQFHHCQLSVPLQGKGTCFTKCNTVYFTSSHDVVGRGVVEAHEVHQPVLGSSKKAERSK